MASLQDIIKLTENDNGKVFVIDETGEVKLVILKVEDYQHLLLGKLKRSVKDIEEINKEITLAQLEDAPIPPIPQPGSLAVNSTRGVDLRSEVIDPNFNFNALPGEEYETIKPDFDDI